MRRLAPRHFPVSSGLRRVQRAGLAIDRGDLAVPHRLAAGISFLDQLLENPAEGAAVRLLAGADLLQTPFVFVCSDCVSRRAQPQHRVCSGSARL